VQRKKGARTHEKPQRWGKFHYWESGTSIKSEGQKGRAIRTTPTIKKEEKKTEKMPQQGNRPGSNLRTAWKGGVGTIQRDWQKVSDETPPKEHRKHQRAQKTKSHAYKNRTKKNPRNVIIGPLRSEEILTTITQKGQGNGKRKPNRSNALREGVGLKKIRKATYLGLIIRIKTILQHRPYEKSKTTQP